MVKIPHYHYLSKIKFLDFKENNELLYQILVDKPYIAKIGLFNGVVQTVVDTIEFFEILN